MTRCFALALALVLVAPAQAKTPDPYTRPALVTAGPGDLPADVILVAGARSWGTFQASCEDLLDLDMDLLEGVRERLTETLGPVERWLDTGGAIRVVFEGVPGVAPRMTVLLPLAKGHGLSGAAAMAGPSPLHSLVVDRILLVGQAPPSLSPAVAKVLRWVPEDPLVVELRIDHMKVVYGDAISRVTEIVGKSMNDLLERDGDDAMAPDERRSLDTALVWFDTLWDGLARVTVAFDPHETHPRLAVALAARPGSEMEASLTELKNISVAPLLREVPADSTMVMATQYFIHPKPGEGRELIADMSANISAAMPGLALSDAAIDTIARPLEELYRLMADAPYAVWMPTGGPPLRFESLVMTPTAARLHAVHVEFANELTKHLTDLVMEKVRAANPSDGPSPDGPLPQIAFTDLLRGFGVGLETRVEQGKGGMRADVIDMTLGPALGPSLGAATVLLGERPTFVLASQGKRLAYAMGQDALERGRAIVSGREVRANDPWAKRAAKSFAHMRLNLASVFALMPPREWPITEKDLVRADTPIVVDASIDRGRMRFDAIMPSAVATAIAGGRPRSLRGAKGPVATVDGVDISAAALREEMRSVKATTEAAYRQAEASKLRRLINNTLVKRGLTERGLTPTDSLEQNTLALMRVLGTPGVDPLAVRQAYDAAQADWVEPESLELRFITVRSESHGEKVAHERIVEAERRLKSKAPFDTVAGELSDDMTAPERYIEEDLGPELWQAARTLKAGAVSKPVVNSLGWHIMRLEKRHPERKIPFTEAEAEIRTVLERRANAAAMKEWLETARARAQITIHGGRPSPFDTSPAPEE